MLALDYYVFRLDLILLGVVRELLTIPLIPAVAAAFIFSVVRLLSNRQSVNACMVSAALILLTLNCFIWSSFDRPPLGCGVTTASGVSTAGANP